MDTDYTSIEPGAHVNVHYYSAWVTQHGVCQVESKDSVAVCMYWSEVILLADMPKHL